MLIPVVRGADRAGRRAGRLRHGEVLRRHLPWPAARSLSHSATMPAAGTRSAWAGSRSAASCLVCCRSCVLRAARSGHAGNLLGAAVGSASRRSGCSRRSPPSRRPTAALIFLGGIAAVVVASRFVVVRLLAHGRLRRYGPPWDCGFPWQTRAHAGHRRRIRPADPAHVRAVLPDRNVNCRSPSDSAPRYRVHIEDRSGAASICPWQRAVQRTADCVGAVAAGTDRRVPALQLPDPSCCWCWSYELAASCVGISVQVAAGDCARAAACRLGQPVPRLAAEPLGAAAAAALSHVAQAVPQGCRRSPRTPRRCFAPRPMCCSARMVLAAAIIPSLATDLPFAPAADAIALVGLFATARVFMSLAAMDIGTAFGTLGARREMMIGFLAEPALLMVLFTASLLYASTALAESSSRRWRIRTCICTRACELCRQSHSSWCCSPKTPAFRSTTRRPTWNSR